MAATRHLTLAVKILAAPDAYPEVIRGYAREIVNLHERKHEAARVLLEPKMREVKSALLLARKRSTASSVLNRSREASMATQKEFGREIYSRFVGPWGVVTGSSSQQLKSLGFFLRQMLRAFEFEDIALMLRYVSAANAKRKEEGLEPVAFIHAVSAPNLCEILLFRLARES